MICIFSKKQKMNKLAIVFFFSSTILLFSFIVQTGKKFPELTGETLENKKITVPSDIKGKFALIGLAYSQKAQDDLETWMQPVYTTFIEKSGGPLADSYDVHTYFIPMFTGANQATAATATKKLQKGIDKELLSHVIIYKGEIEKYKTELSLKDKDKPYFFLLDSEGKIVHTTSGPYSDAKMEEIEGFLE
jgi:hypothetical protein